MIYKRIYVHTYRQTDRQTYLHTYIHTYIQTDRQTYLHTYIHTYIHTSCIHIFLCECVPFQYPFGAVPGIGTLVNPF